jgi:hypothetical protein
MFAENRGSGVEGKQTVIERQYHLAEITELHVKAYREGRFMAR